ncbi:MULTISPECIES: Gfo/Idh/MocA family protein [unclassified Sphingobacterium]|uniref:Gfo/Idh/MocA family protein n=1 Tax=unclassified Sphingobacterium TaxID=2609468 RepID=UPI0025E78024|nr:MULTISPECIES: Gfo/Idh/MocA family oxidoreductase [unclassified Sphingobacterium]
MKVLIIGLGSIAKKHILALHAVVPAIEILAMRSNSENASIFPGVTNVFSIDDLNLDDIDFILIANPTEYHFEYIKRFSVYGKPLFVEKPLFSGLNSSTNELIEDIRKSGVVSYVACNLRFLDSIIYLKSLISNKRVNEVNVYCGSFLPDWRPGVDFKKVYSANKEMGGGVHIDLIHELDYVYWLFGEPVSARSFYSNTSSLGISAYDYANYLWQYPEFPVSVILNYYRKDAKRTIEIVAEEGTYVVDLLSNTVFYDNEPIYTSEQRIIDTYRVQMEFFINEILKNKVIFNPIEEAYKVLELCIQD